MNVCWFSAGVSSFVAAYLCRDILDKVIYCHIDDQHPDTMRFVHDCEKALNIPIEIMQSPYKTVDSVIKQFRFINGIHGAKCTDVLKKRVRKEFEYAVNSTNSKNLGIYEHIQNEYNKKDLTYFWGYDIDETDRAERIKELNPYQIHRFPLIENYLAKEDCHAILKNIGIRRPEMYALGYRNNNCIGCVKGGMGYWNKIRVDFPDVFERRAKQEREVGHTCIKGVYLDELEPNRGNIDDEVLADCSIACQMVDL